MKKAVISISPKVYSNRTYLPYTLFSVLFSQSLFHWHFLTPPSKNGYVFSHITILNDKLPSNPKLFLKFNAIVLFSLMN